MLTLTNQETHLCSNNFLKMIAKHALVLLLFFQTSLHGLAQTADTSGRPNKVFTKVDKPAEFPGGQEGWRAHLEKNLRYPKKAVRRQTQGVVRVQFVVDTTGLVKDVVAMNDPGDGLAEEAVRVIETGGRWVPAEQKGKKVIYRHIQAITFLLQ
jgi:TonB family protein